MDQEKTDVSLGDDLPDNLKNAYLKQKRYTPDSMMSVIIRLLYEHETLTAIELAIGYFRSTGDEVDTKQIKNAIGRLKYKGHVDSPCRGSYRLTDDGIALYEKVLERLQS